MDVSSVGTRRCGGELHRDAEPTFGRGVRMSVPSCARVMLLTIASPRPTPAWSVGCVGCRAERFGERRDPPCAELVAGVLDRERHEFGADVGVDLHGAAFGKVVDDGVVQEIRRRLQQERVRAERGRDVPGSLDRHAVILCEREECLGRLLGEE